MTSATMALPAGAYRQGLRVEKLVETTEPLCYELDRFSFVPHPKRTQTAADDWTQPHHTPAEELQQR